MLVFKVFTVFHIQLKIKMLGEYIFTVYGSHVYQRLQIANSCFKLINDFCLVKVVLYNFTIK